jgi:hypothetical protein
MITTFTLKRVDPLNVRVEDIDIEDIAHSLSLINRFAGHSSIPISVAQHSCYVAWLCEGQEPYIQLQALLHDAAEAYLGDVTKWLKHSPEFDNFRLLEDDVQRVIFTWAGCPLELHPSVETADKLMVKFEAKKAYGPNYIIDRPGYGEISDEEYHWIQSQTLWPWTVWNWRRTEERFLNLHKALLGRCAAQGSGIA